MVNNRQHSPKSHFFNRLRKFYKLSVNVDSSLKHRTVLFLSYSIPLQNSFSFNQAKPKTEVEARVYEVLSHKNWGASSSLLNEIARDTFDYDKFAVISQLVWESLENARPAGWRVVFKGLSLVEHLVKNGSERCVDDARTHGHILRTLLKFNYYEGTVDRGLGVREKCKQITELLSDDERVREERMKSREMRKKLGNLTSATGTGGGGSGGGLGGYGNDGWDQSGGYGNSGIGAETIRTGGGGTSTMPRDTGRYGGRYDEDRETIAPSAAAAEPAPTFAALPDESKKTKKTTKKKPKSVDAVPAATTASTEVDLFSFDTAPAPASAAVVDSNDDFGAFSSAGGANDPFATPSTNNQSFNAFGMGATAFPQQQQQPTFDAFGTVGGMPQPIMSGMQNMSLGGGMGGGERMMPPSQLMATGNPINSNNNNKQLPSRPDDDDFGDFAAAPANNAPKASAAPATSSDPFGRLISLDGLSKNNKKEDKLNQPVIANAAAATFVQEREHIQAVMQEQAKSSAMSFAGIDGLPKSSGSGMMMMSPGMTVPSNPSVMGGARGADAISSMFDPSSMTTSQPQSNMSMPPKMTANPNPMMMMMGTGNNTMNAGMMSNPIGGMMGMSGGMMANPMGGMMMNQASGGMGGMTGNPNMSMMGSPLNAGPSGMGMMGTPMASQMGGQQPMGMSMNPGMGMPAGMGMMNPQQQQQFMMNQMGGMHGTSVNPMGGMQGFR